MIEIESEWAGWAFMGIITIPVVVMWICHFWPKLTCILFGHLYPLISLFNHNGNAV